jgi:hypothetical protein
MHRVPAIWLLVSHKIMGAVAGPFHYHLLERPVCIPDWFIQYCFATHLFSSRERQWLRCVPTNTVQLRGVNHDI